MWIYLKCRFLGHIPRRMPFTTFVFCRRCGKSYRIPIPALEQTGV